ncbi:hypothetical protein AMR42_04185 [Limnothrix sp. PR1529]|uniref:DUF6036 family nucleotidyltransferase n=1 Tax=Limnothrix sp. PR1529 TaxID=1704291 RepID=UPI00081ED799|nr:hypothetical protein BCR12_08405 [Limnothrix sp. P13C2]PIB14806.1 hypothetical protein AMR42_04185 [Limnothrix sp. PR1529]
MVLNPDFREFIECLNANQVRYLVVGGYAVAFHGHPRYTKDLDIWIQPTLENAQKVIQALAAFGFASLNLVASDFAQSDQVVQLGYPPNRIDLITSPDGVDFETCYQSKIESDLDGLKIYWIDLENLRLNKKVSGRSQDLADLESLAGSQDQA